MSSGSAAAPADPAAAADLLAPGSASEQARAGPGPSSGDQACGRGMAGRRRRTALQLAGQRPVRTTARISQPSRLI